MAISDRVKQNANSLHVFTTKFMQALRREELPEKIKRIQYISNGAASQYKNYKKFVIYSITTVSTE